MKPETMLLALVWAGILAITIAFLPVFTGDKPFERTCPARDGEALAYSTYHSNGSLECTYIPHTRGLMKKRITL